MMSPSCYDREQTGQLSQFGPMGGRKPQTSSQTLNYTENTSSYGDAGTGFHQRRFKLKMEKLRKIHERVQNKESSEEHNEMQIDDDGMRSPIRSPRSTQFLRFAQKRNSVGQQRRKSQADQALEREFKEAMGINSKKSHFSSSFFAPKLPADEPQRSLFYTQSLPSTPRNRLDSGPKCEYNLDVGKLNQTTDDQEDYEMAETFDSNLTESSFEPNIIENSTRHTLKIGREAFRLRHFKQYQKCIILPDDPWKVKWDLVLLMQGRIISRVILISSIVTPLRVAFYDTYEVEWVMVQTFIDIVFLFDILFSFFSAYYNKMEELISDRQEIATGYLKSWFFIDLVSIFPLSLFTNSTVNQLAKLARMPRIYKIIKTSKFIRLMKFSKMKVKIRKEIARITANSIETQRILTYAFVFLVLCHNFACLWFLLAKLQDFHEQTWVARYGYSDLSRGRQYIASLYFIITTITTVGYGDITSATAQEQVFCIVLMILGVIAYSIAISSLMSALNASDKKSKRLRWKLNVLGSIRQEYQLNFELYWRLRQALHYEHSTDMTDKQILINELPSKLKVELSNLMYSQEIGNIAYFQNKSPSFIATVAPLLKPLKISKGDYIYLKGDSIDGIYFIKRGESAYVQRRPRADLIFATNNQGSYFGEIDFTASDEQTESKRLFSVKAMSDMDVLFLPKAELYQIDIDFKKEVFHLFHKSYAARAKLQQQSKRSEAWLKKKYESYDAQNFVNMDDTEEVQSEEPNSTLSPEQSPSTRKTEGNNPYNRALTLHKPTNIGAILSNELDGSLLSDTLSDPGKPKVKKRKSKKKRHSQFKQSFIMCPAEVIEEEDRDCDSGRTFTAPNTNRYGKSENKTQLFSNNTKRKKSIQFFEDLDSSKDNENQSVSQSSDLSRVIGKRKGKERNKVLLLL